MFTTQCSGDFGIEVEGRVVAQAFIHQTNEGIFGTQLYKLHVYDLVRGGPHQVLSIDAGLNEMMAIARREADANRRQKKLEDFIKAYSGA